MKIAIIGYGKMGQMVEAAAKAAGHEVVAIVDPAGNGTTTEISPESLNAAEAAIDFTTPESALTNIEQLAELGIPTVVGTTGWYEELPKVEAIIKKAGSKLIYAGNFSIGVQVFYAVAAETARRLSAAGGYDVAITETHHTGKKDAPSGTAKELAEAVLANFPAKKRILLDNSEQPVPPEALQISSSRLGKTVGIHSAIWDDESNTIELTHRGKNRAGYASGAVAAAEWLAWQESGVYTAKDWLRL
jgi:4-hydroxy-tetrahydrodipicolinate reductase